jgi:hypothetical protein
MANGKTKSVDEFLSHIRGVLAHVERHPFLDLKGRTTMKFVVSVLIVLCSALAQGQKTYKHASQYQIAILDQNLRVETGSDVTLEPIS